MISSHLYRKNRWNNGLWWYWWCCCRREVGRNWLLRRLIPSRQFHIGIVLCRLEAALYSRLSLTAFFSLLFFFYYSGIFPPSLFLNLPLFLTTLCDFFSFYYTLVDSTAAAANRWLYRSPRAPYASPHTAPSYEELEYWVHYATAFTVPMLVMAGSWQDPFLFLSFPHPSFISYPTVSSLFWGRTVVALELKKKEKKGKNSLLVCFAVLSHISIQPWPFTLTHTYSLAHLRTHIHLWVVPWELLISSSLLTSDHFASFSHSLTLPGGQERKNKKIKSPIPGLHGISYPASFSSVSVLLFSSFPHTCASILPYPPSKNKVTGSQLLGSVYNPVRGPQYEWKVFFFPIKDRKSVV